MIARRNDPLVAAVQWVAQSLWWFHPLAWWMNREIGRRSASLIPDQELTVTIDGAVDAARHTFKLKEDEEREVTLTLDE